MKKKDGDLILRPGDYHYQASISKNKIKRFWYYAKKTAIQRYLFPGPNDYILDVGCGSGVITSYLGQSCAKAIGIDGDLNAINFAKKTFKNDKCSFIHGLVDESYEFDYLFDKIYCLELIEHIYYEQGLTMLKNFKRLLKKNGKVFVTTPNYKSLWPIIEFMMDKFKLSYPLDKYQHVEHYDKKKLERICLESGFKIELIKTNCFLAPWIAPISWNLALKIDSIESNFLTGSILIAVLRND